MVYMVEDRHLVGIEEWGAQSFAQVFWPVAGRTKESPSLERMILSSAEIRLQNRRYNIRSIHTIRNDE